MCRILVRREYQVVHQTYTIKSIIPNIARGFSDYGINGPTQLMIVTDR